MKRVISLIIIMNTFLFSQSMYIDNGNSAMSITGMISPYEKNSTTRTINYSNAFTYTFQGKIDLTVSYNRTTTILETETNPGGIYYNRNFNSNGRVYGFGMSYHVKNQLPINLFFGGKYETGYRSSDFFDDLSIDLYFEGIPTPPFFSLVYSSSMHCGIYKKVFSNEVYSLIPFIQLFLSSKEIKTDKGTEWLSDTQNLQGIMIGLGHKVDNLNITPIVVFSEEELNYRLMITLSIPQ